MPVAFLNLPAEVQLIVLSRAHFRDVARCRCVCKHLLKVIDSSPALKLIIDLGASARRINPAYPGTSIQKLQELQEINIAWANLHWKHRIHMEFPENVRFAKFSGGVVFCVLDDDPYDSDEETKEGSFTKVVWIELPSRQNLRPDATNLLVFEHEIHDMAIISACDLFIGIVLYCFKANGGYTIECQLHPISITTAEKHPDAFKSVISSRFFTQLEIGFSTIVHVCGNHVGVLLRRDLDHFCRRKTFDVFYLWDWTTGACKVHMNSFEVEEYWESFCFITLDSVLISSTFHGHLNLFRFSDNPDSLTHVYTFVLPEARRNPGLRHIDMCSEPSPSSPGQCTNLKERIEPPFPVDPDDAIVVVRLDYFSPPPGKEEAPDEDEAWTVRQSFAIPRRFFAQALHLPLPEPSPPPKCWSINDRFLNNPRSKRHPHCHSESWIHFSRWGIERAPPDFMLNCVCGSRFLGMTSVLEYRELPFSDITLYDFNLRNERRGVMMLEPNIRTSIEHVEKCNGTRLSQEIESEAQASRWPVRPSRIASDRKIVQNNILFNRRFITTLPYRLTQSEFTLDWDTAALDDERIIGIVMDDGVLKFMDILVM
ncbi:hypothetical protein ACEPAI_3952 [Sanghuangporus weigelae]